ncbi:MAG: MerR family transcriptional regulator [Pseudomonadota bacterium]
MLTIQRVSAELGISADTLRKWEQRYGFPRPRRSEGGFRVYDALDLSLLRTAKELIDQGLRPAKVLSSLAASTLDIEVAETSLGTAEGQQQAKLIDGLLALLRQDRLDELDKRLRLDSMAMGLLEFIEARIVPFMRRAGDAWAVGELPVFREHALSKIVQSLLDQPASNKPYKAKAPKVLLATPSGELHALGLAAAKALLTRLRCQCVDLGPNLPVDQLLACAEAVRPDAIGISISSSYSPLDGRAYLKTLRDSVRPETEVWVGGSGVGRMDSLSEGILAFDDLRQLSAHIASRTS